MKRYKPAVALTERLVPDDIRRFLEFVIVKDGHWIWTGHTDKKGYGQFKYHNKARWAHRISYVTFCGPIPDGITVNHRRICLVSSCVNPDHLELMTNSDNARDRNDRYFNQDADVPTDVPF